jgi:hypothetical protein
MTSESAHPADDPHRLLSSTRDLVRRVRKTQRATWFPLLVFAAVTFAAIPVYSVGGHHMGTCAALPRGVVCSVSYTAGLVYWPIAIVLAYVAIAAFYIRRSQVHGVGTRVRPYVIAGIVLALVATGAALWAFHHPVGYGPDLWLARLGRPSFAIGLALLVLAWAERNRALVILALGYLAVLVVPLAFGGVSRGWTFLPQFLIDGSILLLGGIGFALAQRPWRRGA